MPTKQVVLDNIIQAIGGILCGLAIPLAVQFPDAAPYITVVAGGLAFALGKMYPRWSEGIFTKK